MEAKKTFICNLCKVEMSTAKASLHYLGHNFYTDLIHCAQCGQVYIPEELAKGRMAEVEMMLEDK